ncbi:MAG: hypothetical protein EBU84_20640 [Actinobacteria bacterium]|nr:hypothetical protein [Actinomycetota bacterium]
MGIWLPDARPHPVRTTENMEPGGVTLRDADVRVRLGHECPVVINLDLIPTIEDCDEFVGIRSPNWRGH